MKGNENNFACRKAKDFICYNIDIEALIERRDATNSRQFSIYLQRIRSLLAETVWMSPNDRPDANRRPVF